MMSLSMFVTIWVLISIITEIALVILRRRKENQKSLFRKGSNENHRICRICGAHYQYFEWRPGHFIWADIPPWGNDPKCECHRYAN